jgi:hypothetical protein
MHIERESPCCSSTALSQIRLPGAAVVAVLLFFVPNRLLAGVTHQGSPFLPAGANFQISALQGIDNSTPTGKSTFRPQVNINFEFAPAIGVSYDTGGRSPDKRPSDQGGRGQGKGHLTDFGIGLYPNSAHQVQSTGLKIQYNQPVNAASVTVTLEDFDLNSSDTFFKPTKVEPSILLLGPGGSIYASATPADIFPNLVPGSAPKDSPDVWNLNFAGLLNTLGKPDALISGYVLYADATGGEMCRSDPYLLVSAGNSVQVPEPGSLLLMIVAGCFSCLFYGGRAFLKNKARE